MPHEHRRFAYLAIAESLGIFIAVAAVACDSTARFSVPNRIVLDVQVASVFPAHIRADGSFLRVCGGRLDDQDAAPKANGIELPFHIVGSELRFGSCENDRDLSVHEHDFVEMTSLTSDPDYATVGASGVVAHLQCVGKRETPQACADGLQGTRLTAAALVYDRRAPRCAPNTEASRANIALVMDHSGSISGFVDRRTRHERKPGWPDVANVRKPSDPTASRISAARRFLEILNDNDRLIGWHFNAHEIGVAALDEVGVLPLLPTPDRAKHAFGAVRSRGHLLERWLNSDARFESAGRTPLWAAVRVAFRHLNGTGVANKHMIVLADGPDTCQPGETFDFRRSDGSKAAPCQQIDPGATFENVRTELAAAKWPIAIHFIQFQSDAAPTPDPHMIDIACRSGGTYKFVNLQEIAQSVPAHWQALTHAILRVRNGLAGSWKAAFAWRAIASDDLLANGTIHALSGDLRVNSPRLVSLQAVYANASGWRFGHTVGGEDRRLLLLKPCIDHGQCGGSGPCSPNRCTSAGTCMPGPAPDGLQCPGGSCQQGTCKAL